MTAKRSKRLTFPTPSHPLHSLLTDSLPAGHPFQLSPRLLPPFLFPNKSGAASPNTPLGLPPPLPKVRNVGKMFIKEARFSQILILRA